MYHYYYNYEYNKKKMEENKKEEYSEKEAKYLSDYINVLLSNQSPPLKTRSEYESPKIKELKTAMDIIVLATNILQPRKRFVNSLGSAIRHKSMDKKMSFDDLRTKLGLDIHKFTALLMNRNISQILKNKKIFEKLSDFLEMPAEKIKSLAKVSSPSVSPSKFTRHSINVDTKYHKKLKSEIKAFLEKKYK